MEDVYILEGARTPFGSFGGAFKEIGAMELGVIASKEAINRSGIHGDEIDFSIVGNVIHTSKNAAYISRHLALKAGVSVASPSLTVNRLCGSGLQAMISAAQSLQLKEGKAALACGTENMSQAPFILSETRFGTGLKSPKVDDMLWATLTDEYCGIGMGMTAENLADQYGISREEQDTFALESQTRAQRAKKEGILAEEIVPVEITTKKGGMFITEDEYIRKDSSLEQLSQLKPAFKKNGTVTAGNASGINDGAAALILVSQSFLTQQKKQPLARIVSWAVAGVEPTIMGIGPVPATKKALEKADLTMDDIDLIEVNEAFAAQFLAVEKELQLDRRKTNIYGGAIALGHPVGASGARIVYTLARALKRKKGRYGLAALCIGGGQGIAMIIESC